jgi:hypothetical protein
VSYKLKLACMTREFQEHCTPEMSITLEGNVVAEDDERNWSGLWRFTKEKKSFLSFGFKVRML